MDCLIGLKIAYGVVWQIFNCYNFKYRGLNMTPSISRFTTIGDWVFEVKMVRALRVKRYGDPYTAVATLTANGDQMYIDTQMTREKDDFSRKDFSTFYNFCQQLEMKSFSYDKMKNGIRHSRTVDIVENLDTKPIIRLIK